MSIALLAQIGGYTVGQLAIGLILILAIVAAVYVVARALGVQIPPVAVQLFWIVVIAALGIIAIRFLLSL